MRGNNRKSIEKCRKKLPQFTTMNVIDGQAGLVIYSSLIFYSLTIDNILNIIVLLILAGVSIALLTGDNGILTKVNEAKNKNSESSAKEKILVEVLGSYGTDGKPQLTDIKMNIEKIGGIVKGEKFPLMATIDNYKFAIKSNGEVVRLEELEWTGTVNAPKVAQGMIPIKHDGTNWIICSEDDPEWYEYVNQEIGVDQTSKWANIMLSDGKYKAGSTETENARINKTAIEESELGSMFVWIPRYAYQIENLYHELSTSSGGKINIEFLVGTKKYNKGDKIKSGQLANKSGQANWNEHPAFTFGDKILSGIWVAKFEASSTTLTPDENYGGGGSKELNIKILPKRQSWRNTNISNMFDNCINMNNTKNASFYGISENDNEIDPHLMKNNEWGAVAYLTQSNYGRNGNEVIPNSNGYGNWKYIYTGYAGDNISAGNPGLGTEKPTNVYSYDTPNGMLASTTGNITGIYDMSGGTLEYVAGYVNNGSNDLKNSAQKLIEADEKYKNVYKAVKTDGSEAIAGDDVAIKNYEAMQSIYGDAVWETSKNSGGFASWHYDYSEVPKQSIPFFIRGGDYTTSRHSGIFNFFSLRGGFRDYGFRPTLAVY